MNRTLKIGLALLLGAGSTPKAYAGDIKAGAALADKCQTCHGLDGLAKIAEAPNIAGQNERSYPVVIQYIGDKPYVVWPKNLAQRDVVLPWPAGMTYSYK